MDIESLNNKFSFGGALIFKQLPSGITLIEIDTPLAIASISLEGGQVLTWHPKSQVEPVLWVSKLANFIPGKAIRGGVPICWPWFGPHPSNPQLPGHGYARLTPWRVTSTEMLGDGSIRLCLTMCESQLSKLHWQQQVGLTIEIIIGEALIVKLTTHNQSSEIIMLTEGLHTYFNIGDISATRVHGFDGVEYIDLTKDNERHVQNGPIKFKEELGRIFLNSKATCTIEDQILRRIIHIEKEGSLSTAVWNPWSATAATMADLGAEGWRNMLCVEGANALEDLVTIAPNASHTNAARYFAVPMV